VRISGIDEIEASTGYGPIYAPSAGSYAADVEVPNIRVGPRNENRTLIGAPVTNQVVAWLDARAASEITKTTPYVTVSGPPMEFYEPKLSTNPVPLLKLPLAFFGSTTPDLLDNATHGHRVFIRNVTFFEGTYDVSDDQTAATPLQFLFDTGAPVTIVSQSLGMALGLDLSSTTKPPTQDCYTTTPGMEGWTIDSVEFKSYDPVFGGSYTIENAVVCVDDTGSRITAQYANPTPPPASKKVDAVIGLNLFDHVPILVNLPEGYVGIMPEPDRETG